MPRSVPLALVALLFAVSAPAAVPSRPDSPRTTPVINRFDQVRLIDANQIGMYVTNFGSWGWDLNSLNSGLYFPRGSGRTALYAAGLWLGADPRVTISEYSSEYSPGSFNDDPTHPDHVVYKVSRWRTGPDDTSHVETLTPPSGTDSLVHHSWSEYMAGAVPHGAPWKLNRLPVTSTPDPTDSVDVPGPDVLGDQMLWCVYNDNEALRHNHQAGGTAPLGVEIQQSTFAVDAAGPLGNTVFLKFVIINKGFLVLDPMIASLWNDPDLGGYTDDLVGVDLGRSMGFVYNATNNDQQYGSSPPALGVDLLRGPTGEPDTVGLHSFVKYINGTDPQSSTVALNTMRGLLPDGDPIVNPVTGLPSTFMHDGDPLSGNGWLDANPSDRRMALGTGPFKLAPGDTEVVWAAIVIGQASSRLASIQALRFNDDFVQQYFDLGLPMPPPPPPPGDPCVDPGSNCPRTVSFWQQECAPGPGALTDNQLDQIAAAVDGASGSFDWEEGNEKVPFCALMQSPAPDPRTLAMQEFAAMLATRAAQDLVIHEGDGDCITLALGPPVTCADSTYASVASFLTPLDSTLVATATFVDEPPGTGSPIEGAMGRPNLGLDFSWLLFGSTLDPFFAPDSFPEVELRFDGTQKAYRFLRKEFSDGSPPFPDRGYGYAGFFEVPVTAWDLSTNTQLELGFIERALLEPGGEYSPDTLTIPTMNQTWDPDTSASGSHEILVVFRRPYSGAPNPDLEIDGGLFYGTLPALYTLWSRRVTASGLFDSLDRVTFRRDIGYTGGLDRDLFVLESQSISNPAVASRYQEIAGCVDLINHAYGAPTCDILTPVMASLMDTEAGPDRVQVRWFASGEASGTVERSEGGAWSEVAVARGDASGIITFEDRAVEAGRRYGYRLRLRDGASSAVVGEVWVDVPLAHRLSLAGFRPNPAGEVPFVAFTLPARGAVRLEVLDVTGRRAYDRALGTLEPGPHHVRLDGAARLPAGMYFLRLTHAGASVTTRGVLMR